MAKSVFYPGVEPPLVFGLTAAAKTAARVNKLLRLPGTSLKIDHFTDGEIKVVSPISVRNRDVFLIQSTCPPVNDNLMELLIAIDMLKRASAKSITVVLPYYGYARQDRKTKGREPITSKLVANLIEKAGATRVVLMDIHSEQTQGFFDVPVDSLRATWMLWRHLMTKRKVSDPVIVAPDYGAIKRVRKIAEAVGSDLAAIDKRRSPADNVPEAMNLLGDVDGRNCVIIDDMIDSGGTVLSAAGLLRKQGARTVRLAATHGIFSNNAVARLNEAVNAGIIDEIIITDSIPLTERIKIKNLSVVELAPFFADVIRATTNACPISEVYAKYARKYLKV